jgi:hypothetical protein
MKECVEKEVITVKHRMRAVRGAKRYGRGFSEFALTLVAVRSTHFGICLKFGCVLKKAKQSVKMSAPQIFFEFIVQCEVVWDFRNG